MNENDKLPSIEFEGKTVWPVKGYYKCPFNCHDKRYPKPKWKTVRGFRNHMDGCGRKPSAVIADQVRKTKQKCKADKEAAAAIEKAPHNIGDTVFYVKRTVVKGKYEQRGTRRVKVRYEEICRFSARKAVIKTIGYIPCSIYYNDGITPHDIVESMEVAEAQARKDQISHDKWLRECASYR